MLQGEVTIVAKNKHHVQSGQWMGASGKQAFDPCGSRAPRTFHSRVKWKERGPK